MYCPLSHHRKINDAGCHLFAPQPPAVREVKIHTASVSPEVRGHSRAFFFFRTINLKNSVLQQVLERKNEVLCVLTQKIVTTRKCVISEHVQIEEKCGGMVGIQTKTVQVRSQRVEVPGQRPRGPRSGASSGGVFIRQDSFCSELTEIQLKLV